MADVDKLVKGIIQATGRDDKFYDLIYQSALDACAELLSNWFWPFLKVEGSDTSTSGTREYTLKGDNEDVGVLSYVQYDNTPLDFVSDKTFDELTASGAAASSVTCWRFAGYDAELFPKVQLLGTPSDTGKTIFYRGQKKINDADPFADLPAGMSRIIRLTLLEEWHPNPDSQQRYSFRVRDAIQGALWAWRDKESKVMPFPVHPDKRARNAEINLYRGSVGRNNRRYRTIG